MSGFVHVSESTYKRIPQEAWYFDRLIERELDVKGKGIMRTFLLVRPQSPRGASEIRQELTPCPSPSPGLREPGGGRGYKEQQRKAPQPLQPQGRR